MSVSVEKLADGPRRRHRLVAPLVLALALLIYLPTADTAKKNKDTYSAALGAHVIASTGDPWLDALAPGDYEPGRTWIQISQGSGRPTVSRAPGPIAAGIPAEVARQAVSGGNDFSLAPQALTAAILTSFAILCLFLALSSHTSRLPALAATASFALTTPVWSVSADALWTHPITILGILGMAAFAARERWWLVGVFGGVAVLGRLHTALIVAALGCGMALVQRSPRVAFQVALPSLAGVGLASLWTHWVYGRWSPTGGYRAETAQRVTTGFGDGGSDALTNQLGMWFSPGYGILVWTPVLVLLLPAVIRGWHRVPTWARILPIGGLLYTLAQAQLNTFTGGDGFFGYRHGLEFLATVTPCVAIAVPEHLGRFSSRLLGPILGIQLAAFTIGSTSEAWYILFTDAWTDNSLALALRYEPLYGVLVAMFAVVGYFVGEVVRQRSHPPAPVEAAPAI